MSTNEEVLGKRTAPEELDGAPAKKQHDAELLRLHTLLDVNATKYAATLADRDGQIRRLETAAARHKPMTTDQCNTIEKLKSHYENLALCTKLEHEQAFLKEQNQTHDALIYYKRAFEEQYTAAAFEQNMVCAKAEKKSSELVRKLRTMNKELQYICEKHSAGGGGGPFNHDRWATIANTTDKVDLEYAAWSNKRMCYHMPDTFLPHQYADADLQKKAEQEALRRLKLNTKTQKAQAERDRKDFLKTLASETSVINNARAALETNIARLEKLAGLQQ